MLLINYLIIQLIMWLSVNLPKQVITSIHDMVDCYGISVLQMTTDMFHLS
jgi:hypothetical protein